MSGSTEASKIRSLLEVSEIMEAARAGYVDNLKVNLESKLQQSYTQLLSINGILFQELEQGSKELSIHRRLLYALQTGQLTKEAYAGFIGELEEHRRSVTGTTGETTNSQGNLPNG